MALIRQSHARTVSYKKKNMYCFHLLDLDGNKRRVHGVCIAHAQPNANRAHLTSMHTQLASSARKHIFDCPYICQGRYRKRVWSVECLVLNLWFCMWCDYEHRLCSYRSTCSHVGKQWVTVCKRSVEKYASHHQHLTLFVCEIEREIQRERENAMWFQTFSITKVSSHSALKKRDRGTHLVFLS